MAEPVKFKETELFKKGLAVRREVLGPAYVDKSIAEADEFMKPFQQMVTEWCWGEIWANDDLPRKTRSLINLAMLTALNRKDEVRLHVRGALRNGVSRKEIAAVLLQTAIYCGVPAALDSFKVARDVIREEQAAK